MAVLCQRGSPCADSSSTLPSLGYTALYVLGKAYPSGRDTQGDCNGLPGKSQPFPEERMVFLFYLW